MIGPLELSANLAATAAIVLAGRGSVTLDGGGTITFTAAAGFHGVALVDASTSRPTISEHFGLAGTPGLWARPHEGLPSACLLKKKSSAVFQRTCSRSDAVRKSA